MGTRCNVILIDLFGHELIFYRHSDGYPSGVAPTLGEFIKLIRTDKLRTNVEQSGGWLILLGYEEYSAPPYGNDLAKMRDNTRGTNLYGWKVGAYEPSVGIHLDIEYLYEIDLAAKTLRGWHHDGKTKGEEVTDEIIAAIDAAAA